MARIIEICRLDEAELDVYARLTQAQLRADPRFENGLFIAESVKVIEHALDAGLLPVSMLMARRHISGKARALIERCGDVPVYTADDALLEKLTGYALTRGVLCAMRRPAPAAFENICQNARRVAVLEGVGDPTNLGAIFRSAAALGMDAVLLSPGCGDPLGRRAVRVSMGTVFQIPWARLDQWPQSRLDQLKAMGFTTLAMALTERAVSIEDPHLTQLSRLAVVLGAEGDGLAPDTIAQCDFAVRIPMSHGVDSLNVASASALAFWQLRVR